MTEYRIPAWFDVPLGREEDQPLNERFERRRNPRERAVERWLARRMGVTESELNRRAIQALLDTHLQEVRGDPLSSEDAR